MFKYAEIVAITTICGTILLACGDDENVSSPAGTNYTFSSAKDLSNTPCTKKIEGKTAYFEPEDAILSCKFSDQYDEWVWVNQDIQNTGDKKSSSSSAKTSDTKNSSSSQKAKLSSSSATVLALSSCSKAELPEFDSTTVKLIEPCIVDSVDNCEYETLTDERDGRTYKAVKIGTQTWMAEDLAFKYKSATVRTGCATKTYECGSDSVVYSWSAAMDSAGLFSDEGLYCGDSIKCYHPLQVRGACPVGWHLPNLNEWKTLFTATSAKTWKRLNEFGFAFIYSVFKEPSMKFNPYWTSTEENRSNGKTNVNIINFQKEFEGASVRLSGTSWHYDLNSVRCVKDVETHKSDYKPTFFIDERDGEYYRTVKIGKQHWMAQDLNYILKETCIRNLPLASEGRSGQNYTWAAAVDSLGLFSDDAKECGVFTDCELDNPIRGLCPKGWHLPDSTEWAELFDFVKKDNGGKGSLPSLRVNHYWEADSLESPSTDRYWLSIAPTGWHYFTNGGSSYSKGRYSAKFWTRTQHSPYSIVYVNIETEDEPQFSRHIGDIQFSVRCIED